MWYSYTTWENVTHQSISSLLSASIQFLRKSEENLQIAIFHRFRSQILLIRSDESKRRFSFDRTTFEFANGCRMKGLGGGFISMIEIIDIYRNLLFNYIRIRHNCMGKFPFIILVLRFIRRPEQVSLQTVTNCNSA